MELAELITRRILGRGVAHRVLYARCGGSGILFMTDLEGRRRAMESLDIGTPHPAEDPE